MSDILEVKIKKKEINLIIWLIPLISLIVGGWLVYKYYSNLGPLITIKFKNSGGLEPKRAVVKFRDVDVGKVEKIEILKDEGVLVYVRMNKDMKPFLNKTTKFWIVKPQISLEEVKGLDALISGPYIQMYAKPLKFEKDSFIGLNEPPLDKDIVNGKIFTLIADSTYGLSEKMPVFFKDLKVGSVRKVKIDKNSKVKIIISINKKFVKFINNSTRFWNVKKVDISLIKNYLQVSVPPLKEVLFGGVVFDTPKKEEILTKTIFKLYPSKADAFKNRLGEYHQYKEFFVEFDRDNSYLNIGEVVKFRGFDIGFVKDVNSYFDLDKNKTLSYVVLKIDVGAFMKKRDENIVSKLLQKGLSVYIKKIPILDSAVLNLEFTNRPYKYELIDGKIRLKAIYKKEDSIVDNLNQFIKKLNSLDLNKTLENVNNLITTTTPAISKVLYSIANTSDEVRRMLVKNDKNISALLINSNMLIKNLNNTLNSYSDNSLFYKRVSKTLYDVDKSLKNLNRLLIHLNKKPNSIILGD